MKRFKLQFRSSKSKEKPDRDPKRKATGSRRKPPASKVIKPKTCADVPRNQVKTAFLDGKLAGSKLAMLRTWKPKEPRIGDTIGQCRLRELIGQGSSCTVFLATHEKLQRDVAVKIFPLEKVDKVQAFRKQFGSEARLLAKLDSPYIARIFDFENQELPYLILEYVGGGSLYDRIVKRGAIKLEQIKKTVDEVSRGLAVAHKANIIHRDVKPHNILIAEDGIAKVIDLGIAKIMTNMQGATTGSGDLYGTSAYMAPEQILDPDHIDYHADIYGLGATFYHAVTGQLPFDGVSDEDVQYNHVHVRPTPPIELDPSIPAGISDLIIQMMGKNPKKRPELSEIRRLLRRT